MYLFKNDYYRQIQPALLQQLSFSSDSLLEQSEALAVAEIRSYLTQKYDLSLEFKPTRAYAYGVAQKAGDRVYLDAAAYDTTITYQINSLSLNAGGVYRAIAITTGLFNPSAWIRMGSQYDVFFATLPNPIFVASNYYNVGDKVFWNGKSYEALIITPSLDQQSAYQFGTYQGLPQVNAIPGKDGGAQWKDLGAYSFTAPVDDLTKWTFGDNRSQQILSTTIDIALYHLHSRISPNNTPQLRVDRYDHAKEWLVMASRSEVTADLTRIQPNQGGRIRWGGNVKTINSY